MVLLLAATVVAFALGENVEAVAVLVVIVLNAPVGFLTEWKAEQALTALRKQISAVAHVVRDGQEHQIPAAELVPGDVVVLAAGARVPADGRVIESARLQVEEAALTGESHAVTKTIEPVPDENAPLGDRRNMAFMGTTVTDGRGRLLVTATGMRTEVGQDRDADRGGRRPGDAARAEAGPARPRSWSASSWCSASVIVLAGWLRGNAFLYMLEVGISLAIAAVPEGLPAVATMTLALGMQRMARMRALVRRLPAVETLGSTTVICTDKTGTLTRNEMTVRALQLGTRRVEVTGSGYAPSGEFRVGGQRVDPGARRPPRAGPPDRRAVQRRQDRPHRRRRRRPRGPDGGGPARRRREGRDGARTALNRDQPRIGEVPFSSETKRMVTVHRTPDGTTVAYVKGAPAVVLDASVGAASPSTGGRPLTPEDRERVLAANGELAGRALRVLGAGVPGAAGGLPRREDLARDLVFVGLVGMIDPLRDEAKAAIATCREAGIRTVMITGDQPATAAEIGRQLGLDRDPQGRPLRTVHGRELAGLDAAGWQTSRRRRGVFARVSPEHKLRIVEALQAGGEVVAMTGDGVNDAPALKQADIGVAMGIKGTEVAKEAADMVITDDNFATIVGAVEQGRIIYANILRFVHYLFSCNFAEILVVFVALMVGWPLPLGALQILWLNMITDVFPALALALEPSAPDVMKRPPRDPREPLMTPRFVGLIAWQGLLLSRGDAAGVLRRHALVRHGGRRAAARDHDGVHDAGPGPGLPRLQRPFAAPLGVHRPAVHERLALGGGRWSACSSRWRRSTGRSCRPCSTPSRSPRRSWRSSPPAPWPRSAWSSW